MSRKTRATSKRGRARDAARVPPQPAAAAEIERTPWGGMKLMTAEIAQQLPPYAVIDQDDEWLGPDTIVVARFFAPVGPATWCVVAGSPDTEKRSRYDDDFLCYGYATLDGEDWEWGTLSIKELEEVCLPFGLHVERDLNFRPRPLSEEFPSLFRPNVSAQGAP